MYPNAIKNEGYDAYYDSYKRVLSNKIDFEKLFDIFCLEHNTNYPPTAAWLKEKSILCLKRKSNKAPGFKSKYITRFMIQSQALIASRKEQAKKS